MTLFLQSIYVFAFYSITSHKLQAGKKIFLTILLLFVIGMYIITAEVWCRRTLANIKTMPTQDLKGITLNIGWLGAIMSVAYCSAPLASIHEVIKIEQIWCARYYSMVSEKTTYELIIWKICSVCWCNVFLFQVCRSGSTKSLPFYLILTTCVVTGLWSTYGYYSYLNIFPQLHTWIPW